MFYTNCTHLFQTEGILKYKLQFFSQSCFHIPRSAVTLRFCFCIRCFVAQR